MFNFRKNKNDKNDFYHWLTVYEKLLLKNSIEDMKYMYPNMTIEQIAKDKLELLIQEIGA
jgi:hypothetical protein